MNGNFDIVIVGSGIAGLSTLLYLTETEQYQSGNLSICLIAKEKLDSTNTNWAQGGVAAVCGIGDDFNKHIEDTIVAGVNINDPYIVKKVVESAPSLLNDLIRWGTKFDKNEFNLVDLAKEGGHSEARIWHYKDQTGHSIQQALMNQLTLLHNVSIYEHCQLIKALKDDNGIFQMQLLFKTNHSFKNISSHKLVLATGGLGMLFNKTTNQTVATGDGINIANKLGAALQNLSFIQFHPTGLYTETGNIAFLISEALRGAGAILKNDKGDEFMYKYDDRLDLAPRDIVSRAIQNEINKQKLNFVYLDATKIKKEIIETHFPEIKSTCKSLLNIDINNQMIPVAPVQHYSCGGVKVDEFGETTIPNLFAIGEIASTGLHGANRLASNSLLEAIAFAKYSTEKLVENLVHTYNACSFEFTTTECLQINKEQIQFIINKYFNIIKTTSGLNTSLQMLQELKYQSKKIEFFDYDYFEATSMLDVAILLIQDALNQKTNIGVFYNNDL
jgi:L-aspartate oxidase